MHEIGKERRKFPRIRAELIVRYKILDAKEQRFDGKTKDISGGGLCLVTRERINPGVVLAMDIKFPHLAEPTLISGRVIWSQKSNLGPSPAGHMRFDNGIEFVEINDLDRQRIIEQVKYEQEKMKAEGWKIGIVRNIPK